MDLRTRGRFALSVGLIAVGLAGVRAPICRALDMVTVDVPTEQQYCLPEEGPGEDAQGRWTATSSNAWASAEDGPTWTAASIGLSTGEAHRERYPVNYCGDEELDYEAHGSACGNISGNADSDQGYGRVMTGSHGYVHGMSPEYDQDATWELSKDVSEGAPDETFSLHLMNGEEYVGFAFEGTLTADNAYVWVTHGCIAYAWIQNNAPDAYASADAFVVCSMSEKP